MLPTRPSSPIDFEQIYRDYHKNVYNYIYGQLLHREAAEDLTADVFVAVATHLGQFDPARGSLTAWIFTIARNLTQNYRLRASTRMEESRENLPDMPAVPSKTVDDSLRSPENIRAYFGEALQGGTPVLGVSLCAGTFQRTDRARYRGDGGRRQPKISSPFDEMQKNR